MKGRIRALGLISGGLDSMLASRVLQEQGIEVIGYAFASPFFGPQAAIRSAGTLGIRLEVVEITRAYMDILKHPRYGYGKNMNPCVDCHAFMFRLAGQRMVSENARFLFSGEVLGQRPFSQNRGALRAVANLSGYAKHIVRPLSARLLDETEPERQGWVDRSLLLDLEGRSRRRQMELADRFKLSDVPGSAGGCLLTDANFSRRLRDLLERVPDPEPLELERLKLGRHLRWDERSRLIVGRREEENRRLEKLRLPGEVRLDVEGFPGPVVLLTGSDHSPEALSFAARVAVRYSDAPRGHSCRVAYTDGAGSGALVAAACADDELRGRMI
ncbi:MAG: tRNA 4-thiouridine(8) synthase ThiI [bacterium]